jgi:putative transposase
MTTKEWFSPSEIRGLPGMPGTDRGVRKHGQLRGWKKSEPNKNGSYKFHISSLPEEVRTVLHASECTELLNASEPAKAGAIESRKLQLKDAISDQAAHHRSLEGLKRSNSLPEKKQRRMDARREVLRAADAYRKSRGLTVRRADPEFADAYNTHHAEVEDWIRKLVPKISASSIRGWRGKIKNGNIDHLAGLYRGSEGRGKIDTQPAVRDLIIGLLVAKPHARATHVMQVLEARLGNTDAVLPSVNSLRRWITQWKKDNAQTFLAIANPDAWKNRYMVAFGSQSEGVLRLNQRWEFDSTPADVMLADGRHTVLGVIDVYSRRAKLLVNKTSKATAVATLVRHALLDWGVPEEAKTDNGSDYKGHHITRVFDSLAIQQTLCPPFQPWHKPHIERFFRSFAHDLVELLDGFIGHNVAERKSIEARRSFADRLLQRNAVVEINLSAADFQKFCDRWCEDIYLHRSHDGLKGQTPFEVIAAWREPVRRVEDERALDILLAEAPDNHGLRTVQKKGLQIDNAWFIAPELEAYVGESVLVRFDAIEQDLGRVYVFGGLDRQFLCIAECPERTGMDRREVAARGREIQKQRVQEERRVLKAAARAIKTDDIVDEILRDRALKSGKLRLFPAPAEVHDSVGLQAAREAIAATSPTLASRPNQDALDRGGAIVERLMSASPAQDEEDLWTRYQALSCRSDLTDAEAAWMHAYETTPEYRANMMVSRALGAKS